MKLGQRVYGFIVFHQPSIQPTMKQGWTDSEEWQASLTISCEHPCMHSAFCFLLFITKILKRLLSLLDPLSQLTY